MDQLTPWNHVEATRENATFCTGDVCETKAGRLYCRPECVAVVEPYCEVFSVDDPKAEFVWYCKGRFPPELLREDGFGFVKGSAGWVHFPHYGRVIYGKNVEIGRGTYIDRGSLSNTVIGDGTKIDNLVHVAHNVQIGKRCLIVAGAIIGGSVTIGDDCFIGIGALIKNGVKIGDGATVGMGAVVIKDVPAGATVVGNPAREI